MKFHQSFKGLLCGVIEHKDEVKTKTNIGLTKVTISVDGEFYVVCFWRKRAEDILHAEIGQSIEVVVRVKKGQDGKSIEFHGEDYEIKTVVFESDLFGQKRKKEERAAVKRENKSIIIPANAKSFITTLDNGDDLPF